MQLQRGQCLAFLVVLTGMLTPFGSATPSDAGPAYRWVCVTMEAPFAARDGAGALVYRDRMWLIGGWNSRDASNFPLDCVNDVWSSKNGVVWVQERANTFGTPQFDPEQDWEGRHTAGYVVHRGAMWIVGGIRFNVIISMMFGIPPMAGTGNGSIRIGRFPGDSAYCSILWRSRIRYG